MGALSETIKERRRQRGLSLQKVADAAGITKTHVWDLEAGKCKNPTIETVFGLATALGIKPHVLAAIAMSDIDTAEADRVIERVAYGLAG